MNPFEALKLFMLFSFANRLVFSFNRRVFIGMPSLLHLEMNSINPFSITGYLDFFNDLTCVEVEDLYSSMIFAFSFLIFEIL